MQHVFRKKLHKWVDKESKKMYDTVNPKYATQKCTEQGINAAGETAETCRRPIYGIISQVIQAAY